jgi:hypothetical protein
MGLIKPIITFMLIGERGPDLASHVPISSIPNLAASSLLLVVVSSGVIAITEGNGMLLLHGADGHVLKHHM